MAKTKPIGVRFDENLLEIIKEKKIAETPQKALNFLTDLYKKNHLENGTKKAIETSEISVQKTAQEKPPILKESNQKEIPPIPVREKGEDTFDFAARKNEWKRQYGS